MAPSYYYRRDSDMPNRIRHLPANLKHSTGPAWQKRERDRRRREARGPDIPAIPGVSPAVPSTTGDGRRVVGPGRGRPAPRSRTTGVNQPYAGNPRPPLLVRDARMVGDYAARAGRAAAGTSGGGRASTPAARIARAAAASASSSPSSTSPKTTAKSSYTPPNNALGKFVATHYAPYLREAVYRKLAAKKYKVPEALDPKWGIVGGAKKKKKKVRRTPPGRVVVEE